MGYLLLNLRRPSRRVNWESLSTVSPVGVVSDDDTLKDMPRLTPTRSHASAFADPAHRYAKLLIRQSTVILRG